MTAQPHPPEDRRFTPRYTPNELTVLNVHVYDPCGRWRPMEAVVSNASALGLGLLIKVPVDVDDLMMLSIPATSVSPGSSLLYRIVRCERGGIGHWTAGAELIEVDPSDESIACHFEIARVRKAMLA